MREITTHKGNPLDDALKIEVLDAPGHGGACHRYQVAAEGWEFSKVCHVAFQNGPVNEHGVNGVSIESLLAICIDRLEGFQSGPYKNDRNAFALADLKSAMRFLKERTADRQARGVEGTSAQ